MKLTVRPWQLERPEVARAYEEALERFPNLVIADVTRAVSGQAARLRARHALRPADALHIATALVHGATAFVTNDRDLGRLDDLDIVLPADFAA
jgi:predicted nucleic acid-binding protein